MANTTIVIVPPPVPRLEIRSPAQPTVEIRVPPAPVVRIATVGVHGPPGAIGGSLGDVDLGTFN